MLQDRYRARVLLLGLGDLGRRLALALARADVPLKLILGGRNADDGAAFAALVACCGAARVRFERVDVCDRASVAAAIRGASPDVVVQCASLMSPWAIGAASRPEAQAIAAAGFALQLPAQLPAVLGAMRGARDAGFAGPIVNASFPDATHPILARLGLAPTIGIGNAGMILAVVRNAARAAGRPAVNVRVLAHHRHVTAVMTRDPQRSATHPRVWIDDARADQLAYQGAAMAATRELNALTARHGVEVIEALLGVRPLATAAPGPLGLPGGWPVRIARGAVELDLPRGLSVDAARQAQEEAAIGDGLAHIADDGTATFTDAAQRAVAAIDPQLAAPLAPDDSSARFAVLRRHAGGAA